ncbi:MAG: hypothetical protein ACOX58_10060 [Christensenellales bacterium]|jgi:hypothetical protein
MSVVLYIVAIIGSLINLSSERDRKWLNWVVLSAMLIIAANVIDGYDTKNLWEMFAQRASGNKAQFEGSFFLTSAPYMAMMDLAAILGVSNFSYFKVLTLLMFTPFALLTFRKFGTRTSFVLLLYLLFSFWIDITQHRTMLAMFIFVFATQFLLIQRRVDILIYTLLIAVSAAIHISFAFYFIFLILFIKNEKLRDRVVNVLFIFGSLMYLYLFAGGSFSPLIVLAQKFNLEKLSAYLQVRTRFGSLYPLVLYAMLIAVAHYCSVNLTRAYATNVESSNDKRAISRLVLQMHQLLVLTMPLCVLTLSAMRLVRNVFPVLLISVWMHTEDFQVSRKRKLVAITVLIVAASFFLYCENVFLNQTDDILLPVLQGNFSWIK